LSLPDNNGFFVEQGDHEHRQASESTTFQSQGKFILLISFGCTDLETICKVLTYNSNLSKEFENLFGNYLQSATGVYDGLQGAPRYFIVGGEYQGLNLLA
jgi:hypothetical protein